MWVPNTGTAGKRSWQLAHCVSFSDPKTVSFIMHRTYRTSIQLLRWGRRDAPICPKWQLNLGSLIHMLWKCLKLVRYWEEVVITINCIDQVQLQLNLITCILGGLLEEFYLPSTYIALVRLRYLARKMIARYWLSPQVPTSHQWVQQVNKILNHKKNTYQHRNAAQKFSKNWRKWLETLGVPPPPLTTDFK